MSKLKKYLSYVYPIIEKKILGEHGSLLELLWVNGVLTLNTHNANYSFGSMYQIFKNAFKRFKFNPSSHHTILILGFGAGSLYQILQKDYRFKGKIVGIEFDQKVIDLSRKYFNIPPSSSNLEIIHADAFSFLENGTTTFNTIIIDLFLDLDVPEKFLKQPFFEFLKNRMEANGQVFFNIIDNSTQQTILSNTKKIIAKIGLKSEVFTQKMYDSTNHVFKIYS